MAKQIIKRAARKATKANGKSAKVTRRTRATYAPTAKIKVLAKANPFRSGSSRHAAFAILRNGITVASAVGNKHWGKYGVRRVRLFANKGLIAVA